MNKVKHLSKTAGAFLDYIKTGENIKNQRKEWKKFPYCVIVQMEVKV